MMRLVWAKGKDGSAAGKALENPRTMPPISNIVPIPAATKKKREAMTIEGMGIGDGSQVKVVDQCANMGYGVSVLAQAPQETQLNTDIEKMEAEEPQANSPGCNPANANSQCLIRDSIFTQSRSVFQGLRPSQQQVAVERIRCDLAERKKHYFKYKYLRRLKQTTASKRSIALRPAQSFEVEDSE